MSKIEEVTVEQTDEVVGGTSDGNTRRGIQMSTVSTHQVAQATIDQQFTKTYAADSKRYDTLI